MLKRKDLLILSYLRKNARQRLTSISRRTHIPVTTIYDNVRKYERKFIIKHASIVDFRKLGFNAKTNIALKVNGSRAELLSYLQDHPNVNSLYRTDSEYDVLAELVFRELRDVDEFVETLKKRFPLEKSMVLNITDDLKREDFMSKIAF
ncbi:Lrp/AsnC family transcriptional regulator [Candidatus Woesearchaeota archaeon]|nr:Lrp/AsnC family transcriptional regulator [Candidatus Woesearchaeota archaeon]